MPEIARAPEELAAPQRPQNESFGSGLHQNLTRRVSKYARRKRHCVAIATALEGQLGSVEEFKWLARRIANCSSWLKFLEFVPSHQVQLSSANFCDSRHLCEACAHQRSVDLMYRYVPAIWAPDKGEKTHFMLTLTWPSVQPADGAHALAGSSALPDQLREFSRALNAGLDTGERAMRTLWNRRKVRGSGPFRHVRGLICNAEVTMGAAGLHPHFHCLVTKEIGSTGIDINELRAEWIKLTGGHQMHIARLKDPQDCLEVFKYSVKPAELVDGSAIDPQTIRNHAMLWWALRGRRMLRSYGCYFGLGEPDLLADRDPALSEAFREWLAVWSMGLQDYQLGEVE